MRFAILAMTATLFTGAPSFAQELTAKDVLQKAIEAHGGAAALNKYPAGTSKMTGELTIGGFAFPFKGTLAFDLPGKLRLFLEAEAMGMKMNVTQIVNGDKVVQIENNKTTKLSDTMRQELLQSPAIQEMALLTPLLDAKKYTLSRAKDEEVNGKLAYAVLVKRKIGKDVTLYFDAKTGLLVKMSRKALNPMEMEVTEDSLFSDFQKISGMIVPLKLAVEHDGKPFMSVTVSDYTPLEKLPEKEFTVAD